MFIHSSVDGHLDCFHLWAVVYNASAKTFCVDVFSLFLGLYLGVELLGHMVTLFNL